MCFGGLCVSRLELHTQTHTHKTKLDLLSDPSGTESLNVQISQENNNPRWFFRPIEGTPRRQTIPWTMTIVPKIESRHRIRSHHPKVLGLALCHVSKIKFNAVRVLGLAPCHTKIRWKLNSRCRELIRLCFQHKWIASLGAVSTVLCTPLHWF